MARHPELRRKLWLLYASGVLPQIDCHSALAKQLGIARQNINKWINGSECYRADAIPRGQLERIAALYQIEAQWFGLPLEDFERAIQARFSELRRQTLRTPEKAPRAVLRRVERVEECDSLLRRAAQHGERGNTAAALSDLFEALALAQASDSQSRRWNTLLQLAELHAFAANTDYARGYLREAAAIREQGGVGFYSLRAEEIRQHLERQAAEGSD